MTSFVARTPVPTADVLEENPRHRTNEDLECRYDLSLSSARPVTLFKRVV